MTSAASHAGSTPPAARVPDNEWTRLEPPTLGAWKPSRPVSVIIPVYQAHEALGLCLAALAVQTYPADLLEVVVADDGSEPPVARQENWPAVDVTIVRQPHDGFGAGRARNLGAAAAAGEILIFLDADMVLEPHAVEAHARWHHVAADAATLGFRRHADFAGLTPSDITRAAAGEWPDLLAGREQWDVEWIARHLERTERLTTRRDDLFRVVASGNLGVRAEMFHETGGFRGFGIRGIEDTEFGYRLYTNGALLVPDEHTLGWHQGRSFFQGPGGATAKEVRRSRTANHIPLRGFRDPEPGRSYPVPRVLVRIPWDGEPAEQVVAAVGSVLGGDWHDVVARVEVRSGKADDQTELAHHFDGDQRVEVVADPPGTFEPSPVQVTLPPGGVAGPGTVARIWERLETERIGVLHLAIPDADGTELHARAVRTRALRRAIRVATSTGEPVDQLLADLFGAGWTSGDAVGIRPYGSDEAEAPRSPDAPEGSGRPPSGTGRPSMPLARGDGDRGLRDRLEDAEGRLAAAESQVRALRDRRVIRVADAVTGLRRAATLSERRSALRRLTRAVRRPTR